MEIRTYNSKQLTTLLDDNNFWQKDFLPISKQRIISQIQNPALEDSDILLLVAFHNEAVIGYIGLMPNYYVNQNKYFKYFWGTTWWVDPKFAKMGIGAYLLMGAFENTKNRFAAIAFTESAKKMYANSDKLSGIKEIEGSDFIFRYDIESLKNEKNNFKNIVKRILLPSKNFLSNKNNNDWCKTNIISAEKIEYLNFIDKDTNDFILQKNKSSLSFKNSEYLNWILKYPWVLEGIKPNSSNQKYHFTSVEKSFSYICFKVFNRENEIFGFVLMRLRDGHLYVPYLFANDEAFDLIAKIIWQHITYLKVKTFTNYNAKLISSIKKQKLPFLHEKKVKLPFVLSKEIEKNISEFSFQDGDGDCVFT